MDVGIAVVVVTAVVLVDTAVPVLGEASGLALLPPTAIALTAATTTAAATAAITHFQTPVPLPEVGAIAGDAVSADATPAVMGICAGGGTAGIWVVGAAAACGSGGDGWMNVGSRSAGDGGGGR